MTDKKPIYFVLETGTISGGVRVLGEMMNRLVSRGWPVTVCCLHPRRSMDAREKGGWFDLNGGVKWLDFYKTGTLQDYEGMMKWLKGVEGIKVATYWRTASAMMRFEVADPNTCFYVVQDYETTYAWSPLDSEEIINTYGGSLRVLATSRYVEKKIPHASYIGLGLSEHYRAKGEKRNGEALACLRVMWFKGYSELCETLRYLARAGRQVTAFGIDRQAFTFAPVRYVFQPDDRKVRELYNAHSCFISTSIHEGFNLTKLEAMACGCPVVGTPDDGSDEYVVDGENCIVARTPREVADGVLSVLQDPGLGNRLAKAGMETARRYKWAEVIDRMEAEFRTV